MPLYRPVYLAIVAIAVTASGAFAQSHETAVVPVLRTEISVAGDLVRIGDVVDNAGPAAQIAIYRAPDLGTTGSLPVSSLLAALRAHHVIGVETRGLRDIAVTRRARILDSAEIERQTASALAHRGGLGGAANLTVTFDRDLQQPLRFDAANSGALQPISVRFDPRGGRFDITFEIAGESGAAPARLRLTGSAIETVEAAVLSRGIERGEVIKASDLVMERRPKADIGSDGAPRDRTIGMQARRQLRAGQALRGSDLAKPDLVQRDQAVTLIYDTAGLYLTVRGKAVESGTEGDAVTVLNLQSKRTVSGTVVGRGQVAVTVAAPRPAAIADNSSAPAAVAVAAAVLPTARQAE